MAHVGTLRMLVCSITYVSLTIHTYDHVAWLNCKNPVKSNPDDILKQEKVETDGEEVDKKGRKGSKHQIKVKCEVNHKSICIIQGVGLYKQLHLFLHSKPHLKFI